MDGQASKASMASITWVSDAYVTTDSNVSSTWACATRQYCGNCGHVCDTAYCGNCGQNQADFIVTSEDIENTLKTLLIAMQ